MGTLKAMRALGYHITPGGAVLTPGHAHFLDGWEKQLESDAEAAQKGDSRAWTFDMDDLPELEKLPKAKAPIAHDALSELQEKVHSAWKTEDATAQQKQAWHKHVAALAIWPGILAIVFAILQLTTRHLLPAHPSLSEALSYLELAAVFIAAIAVGFGFYKHLHHGWLEHRQRAERLRILKFTALSWPELWCDMDRWKARLSAQIANLNALTTHAAHHWAREKDTVRPYLPELFSCDVPKADLQALTILYRVKRLQFQRHYFQVQAGKAQRNSWIVDSKLGLWLFALSVLIVFIHGGHHIWHNATSHGHSEITTSAPATFDILSITLAALLPVIGFGFRAWLAAFEAPRSRNLYRAKALALDDYIARSAGSTTNAEDALHHIAHAEHFFTNEHREWCRLQMEAEWFV